MAILLPYHDSLKDLLATQPLKGRGHPWLLRVALHLRHYHTEAACFRLLRECADQWKDRVVPDDEIWKAVRKAYSATGEEAAETARVPWPDPDPQAIARVISSTAPAFALAPLDIPVSRLLPSLFAYDELVCVGYAQHEGCTATLQEVEPNLDKYQYIVPSPMTARQGRNQDGDLSFRSLSITGPRRYLVVEGDSATKEEQARVLTHLASLLPLVLVVDSAGKSLHGWYAVTGLPEHTVRLVMEYAVHLGADPHTWVRCQWVRMPGGTRYGTEAAPRPQPVLFAHPEIIKEAYA